ncbi:glycoside hydrolase family 10 [bacterium]|nr:glycoside hydrolase family 10 [bacterium]
MNRFFTRKPILIHACITVALLSLICLPSSTEVSEQYKTLWDDPELNQTIENNIDTYRKGHLALEIVTEDGQPVPNTRIKAEQTGHEFLFGCNLFFLKGFDSDNMNQKYEEAFVHLFNFATMPFYWSDLEPEPGNIRFQKNSEPIFRRPPPDVLLEFGFKHNLTLKGHPLIWHAYYPGWLPDNQAKVEELASKRFSEIAARYGQHIKIWDVVNESLVRPMGKVLPRDYVPWTFKEANKRFPEDNILMINEVTSKSHEYDKTETQYYLQIKNLLARNIHVDGIGYQFHMFSEEGFKSILAGNAFKPKTLLQVYELYHEFDLPLYITEITIPSLGENGENDQAVLVKNFYRLWFSIPNMAGITWWNLGDGTALKRENKWVGGLMDEDLEPKQSYQVLDQLINQEWKTEFEGETNDIGRAIFHGFYGPYTITVETDQGKQDYTINHSSDTSGHHTIVIED